MKMHKVKIRSFEYKNSLGAIQLRDIELSLDEDEYQKYKKGQAIEDLDYGMSGETITLGEKLIAKEFFKAKYKAILSGEYQLNVQEIGAIQDFLNLNNQDFATILGIDKGSFTNIIKRGKLSRPVGLLIIERLGMELSRHGSAKRLVDPESKLDSTDKEISKEVNDTRYGDPTKVAS